MTFREYYGEEAVAEIRERLEEMFDAEGGFVFIGNFDKARISDAYCNATTKIVTEMVTQSMASALADNHPGLRPSSPVVISELTDADVGRWVIYDSKGGDKHEHGRIKSWNDSGVFVVYNESAKLPNWQDYTAAHTDPEDLEFQDGTH